MATGGSGSEAATDVGQNSTQAAAPNTATSMPPPEQGLKCPRCDSPNTKFCYYNNYSLSQPRHFCKTCRRYWTKGGALRNVPVGGGCRKNKKSKSSALSRLSLVPTDHIVGNFSDPGSVGLQNLLSGPSQLVAAASDFQLGVLPFSRLHSPNSYNMPTTNKYVPAGEIPSQGSAFSPPTISAAGLSYPVSSAGAYGKLTNNGSSHGVGGTIASSIESLSFINQDLHLKLQQQRMAMLFGGETKEAGTNAAAPVAEGQMQPMSPNFGDCSGLQKSWFAESSFALPTDAPTGTDHVSRIGSDDGINNTSSSGNNPSYWNGAGSSGCWNDMLQFTAMP